LGGYWFGGIEADGGLRDERSFTAIVIKEEYIFLLYKKRIEDGGLRIED
jgi:hypothetical protein